MTTVNSVIDAYLDEKGIPGDQALDAAYQLETRVIRSLLGLLEDSLLEAGIDTIELPRPPGWRYLRLSPVWLMARMPDDTFWEGLGATTEEAKADAWRHWRKQQLDASLPRMHREYRRRQAARGRRRQ